MAFVRKRHEHGPRPGTAEARAGGLAAREKLGPDFYRRIGRKGGKHGARGKFPRFFHIIGGLGGEQTLRAHGREHFVRIGAKGGKRSPAAGRGREARRQRRRGA